MNSKDLEFQLATSSFVRIHELAVKNQSNSLTYQENMELQAILKIGMEVDLLFAKVCALSMGGNSKVKHDQLS